MQGNCLGAAAEGGLPRTPLPIQRGPTPIKLPHLCWWLSFYLARVAAARLAADFSVGFRIPAKRPVEPVLAENLRSVKGLEHIVREKIAKEVEVGRVVGPFVCPLFKT